MIREDRIELKQKIFFATASDQILSKSFGLLNEVAQALSSRKTLRVRIEGHTDTAWMLTTIAVQRRGERDVATWWQSVF